MKIKEKLGQGLEWAKQHKYQVVAGTLSLGLIGVGLDKLIKATSKNTTVPVLESMVNTAVGSHEYPHINLELTGIMEDFWEEGGVPNAIISNVYLKDFGELADKLVANAPDIINPHEPVSMVLSFNNVAGD